MTVPVIARIRIHECERYDRYAAGFMPAPIRTGGCLFVRGLGAGG